MTLTEARQALRDQIWLAGPEHFDVSQWFTRDGKPYIGMRPSEFRGISGDWTACFIGHADLICVNADMFRMLGQLDDNVANADFMNLDGWHMINIDGWNPGAHYDELVAGGMDDLPAQWHTAVEWLDRVIKGGE